MHPFISRDENDGITSEYYSQQGLDEFAFRNECCRHQERSDIDNIDNHELPKSLYGILRISKSRRQCRRAKEIFDLHVAENEINQIDDDKYRSCCSSIEPGIRTIDCYMFLVLFMGNEL